MNRRGATGRLGLVLGPGLALVVVLVLGTAAPVAAHPLGNFTVNVHSGLRVSPDRVDVELVVDMAEIPTFQLGRTVTADPRAWAARTCAESAGRVVLVLGGRDLAVAVTATAVSFPPGEGGLPTLRLVCSLVAPTGDLVGEQALVFTNGLYGDRLGWREVTAVGDRATIVSSDVGRTSISGALVDYPDDLLQSPLDQRGAALRVKAGGPGAGALGAGEGRDRGGPGGLWSFTSLVGSRDLTLGFGLLAMGAAIVLGALHALAPGHGKTVMAAYVVGRRGSWRQAAFMGISVTFTHTAGVVVLALAVSASSSIVPERVYPWVTAASGLLLAAIGLNLLRTRHRAHPTHSHDHAEHAHDIAHTVHAHAAHAAHGPALAPAHDHPAHDHPAHDHPAHDHPAHAHPAHAHPAHGLVPAHAGPAHDHPARDHPAHDHPARGPVGGGHRECDGLGALPGQGERGRRPHERGGGHGPVPAHAGPAHDPDPDPVPVPAHAGPAHDYPAHDHPAHDHPARGPVGGGHRERDGLGALPGQGERGRRPHERGGGHSHGSGGGHGHSHDLAPGASRREMLMVGLAGGMVPTPSAVVVVLGALALGQAWFGLLLIVGYGLGMAASLVAVGLLLARARTGIERRLSALPSSRLAGLMGLAPVVASAAIVVAGLALAVRGLAQA